MTILKIESGNFATSLTTATLTQNQSITLPNASGELTLRSQLATVATTGSYNDLTNKPNIPASQSGYVTQTWRNGASWYRRWSDGFIEQGGAMASTGGWRWYTQTLHTSFSSTNYIVLMQLRVIDGSSAANMESDNVFVGNLSTNSFRYRNLNSVAVVGQYWYACGY